MGAAIVLVVGLAAGWVATARADHPHERAAALTAGSPVPDSTAATVPRVTTSSTPAGALLRLLPAGIRCAERHESATAARCAFAGVDVEYRLTRPDAVSAAYFAAIGAASTPRGPGSGPPACARGGEEERAWSRPAAPRRAVGRYACRIEQGRAAMWWSVGDRGVLAHAVAADADLASLFAWWESHSER